MHIPQPPPAPRTRLSTTGWLLGLAGGGVIGLGLLRCLSQQGHAAWPLALLAGLAAAALILASAARERRLAVSALRQQQEQLEYQVRDHTHALEEALRERQAEEAARQELMRVHRDALVREVHHRIKNNLQGIIGLLRQHLQRAPEHSDALETAIAQVNSVAMVYGLQAREKGQVVRLRGLIESVCEATTSLTGARITLVPDGAAADASLAAQESVPVALVLNELVTNAVKHRSGGKLVSLALDWHDDQVMISIRNPAEPGAYPPPAGRGGTGLSLVRALLPNRGAELDIVTEPLGDVLARLRLSPPVLFVEYEKPSQQQGVGSHVPSADTGRG